MTLPATLSDDITSQIGTFALVPQVVDAVRIPVIAAGGIGDHRGLVAALALGASAVQIGTAYLFCPEAKVSAAHRHALDNAPAQALYESLGWVRDRQFCEYSLTL